jgi:pSer/pThr/pTyr-binding forkhead associated (FHA) protein
VNTADSKPLYLIAAQLRLKVPVGRAPVVVGRHRFCDVRIDSIRVSRLHCCLTEKDGEVLVRDLGSSNGIQINGVRVESGCLRDGDELLIAHLAFHIQTHPDRERSLEPRSSSSERGWCLRFPSPERQP